MFDSWGDQEENAGLGSVATMTGSVGLGRLPAGLSEMEPGARLGNVLASIDRDRLNGEERVIVMQAWNRQVAHAQAELYASMTAVAEAEAEAYPGDDPFEINDLGSSEIGAALTLTRRSADYHLGFAQQLIEDYPELWHALHRGRVDLPKTRVIINQTSHLDGEIADEVTKTALERAHRQTTGQLRARLHKLVIEVDPDSALRRYEEGITRRRLTIEATETGTANIFGLDLPPADSNSAIRHINRLAREHKTAGETRTMDQIRADIFLDLLHGRHQQASPGGGVVDIRIDLTTLADLDDNPGEIPGWGPVIADIARKVVREQEESEWRATVTDQNGAITHVVTTRRRPTRKQRRKIESVAPTCVFPGCRMPARQCDVDHRRDWARGGPTQDHNLEPLCRHHHRLKHAGWNLEKLETGQYVWTSPLGLRYTIDPRPP